MTGLLTFTNLFPSAAMPGHGLFVRERMLRVVRALGWDWRVVAPRPRVPVPLRPLEDPRTRGLPATEIVDGIAVDHPAYPHWPGLSLRAQARRMAAASLDTVRAATAAGTWILDAHYLYPDGVAAARLAEHLSLPYVLSARGTDVNVLARRRAVAGQIARAVRNANAVVAVSTDLADRLCAQCGLQRNRVQVVRNGVDLERFRPGDRAAARARLGLPGHGPLVLGVGRLVRSKGFHLAAEAIARLDAGTLVLVGEGAERRRIARAAAGRALFLGALSPDRVAEAYRACDVLVLPSEREGWPNVVNEALASGLPVVASAVGGIPEILTDPRCGVLVPAGDVAPLAAALQELLARPPEREGVRAFAERYSWDEPVAQLAELFREIAGRPVHR